MAFNCGLKFEFKIHITTGQKNKITNCKICYISEEQILIMFNKYNSGLKLLLPLIKFDIINEYSNDDTILMVVRLVRHFSSEEPKI